jgi:hypothetical protein
MGSSLTYPGSNGDAADNPAAAALNATQGSLGGQAPAADDSSPSILVPPSLTAQQPAASTTDTSTPGTVNTPAPQASPAPQPSEWDPNNWGMNQTTKQWIQSLNMTNASYVQAMKETAVQWAGGIKAGGQFIIKNYGGAIVQGLLNNPQGASSSVVQTTEQLAAPNAPPGMLPPSAQDKLNTLPLVAPPGSSAPLNYYNNVVAAQLSSSTTTDPNGP